MHEPKKEHTRQIQTLLTDSKCQDVVVIRQPSHLAALPSPFCTVERHLHSINLPQRPPATDEADGCADQKPERNEVDGENARTERVTAGRGLR